MLEALAVFDEILGKFSAKLGEVGLNLDEIGVWLTVSDETQIERGDKIREKSLIGGAEENAGARVGFLEGLETALNRGTILGNGAVLEVGEGGSGGRKDGGGKRKHDDGDDDWFHTAYYITVAKIYRRI